MTELNNAYLTILACFLHKKTKIRLFWSTSAQPAIFDNYLCSH